LRKISTPPKLSFPYLWRPEGIPIKIIFRTSHARRKDSSFKTQDLGAFKKSDPLCLQKISTPPKLSFPYLWGPEGIPIKIIFRTSHRRRKVSCFKTQDLGAFQKSNPLCLQKISTPPKLSFPYLWGPEGIPIKIIFRISPVLRILITFLYNNEG
jgi:hypothetical protein